MLKKLWHDPVWSTVIASLIVAILLGATTYFLNLWPKIWEFLKNGYGLFLSSTEIPYWVLGLLGALSLPTIFLFFLFLKKVKEPIWRTYREALFFNLKWRWDYGDDGFIFPLHTFCPHCDLQVYPRDASAYRAVDRIAFECEGCGHRLGEQQESLESLENKVRRFIQQKLRNNTWLERVKPEKG